MNANLKGSQFLIAKKFIEEKFGPEAFDKILEQLPDPDKTLLCRHLYSINMYPEQTLINLIIALDKIFGKGDYKLCEEIGAYGAEVGTAKIFKVFIHFGDPLFVLSRSPIFWKRIHDHGSIKVTSVKNNTATLQIQDYKTPHQSFCMLTIGYFKAILKMSGAKNIELFETKCVTKGANCCEFSAAWD
ncbi:MAG: hypothetical protein ABIG64_02930 [Candidatus Omnitrophota bacterium]